MLIDRWKLGALIEEKSTSNKTYLIVGVPQVVPKPSLLANQDTFVATLDLWLLGGGIETVTSSVQWGREEALVSLNRFLEDDYYLPILSDSP